MERLQQRIETAEHALHTLTELSSQQDVSDIVRDAAIQRFEYTFEAMWKATKLFITPISSLLGSGTIFLVVSGVGSGF